MPRSADPSGWTPRLPRPRITIRRPGERSPSPLISLSVTAGQGCGCAGQPHPRAPRRPRPHRTAPPRRSGGPDRLGSPCTRSASRPSGNPSSSPGGIRASRPGFPLTALRRDPRPASPPRATGPVQQARQKGMPALRQSGRPCRRHDRMFAAGAAATCSWRCQLPDGRKWRVISRA